MARLGAGAARFDACQIEQTPTAAQGRGERFCQNLNRFSRSSLHRCLQRHDISRLPEVDGNTPAKTTFKADPLGYFHIDIAEVQTAEGKLYLFVGIDRTSKFAYVELHPKAGKVAAAALSHAI